MSLGIGVPTEQHSDDSSSEYLVARGLQPTQTLLDVGCASFGGDMHFIRYLEPGH